LIRLKKLLQINRTTGIETRSSIKMYESGFANQTEPPSISDLDQLYRQAGVDLTVQACKKALREWGGEYADITHTIAVTCTNQGNPGYDLLVNRKLGLSSTVDRMLLHGVGCAGGLAIMRAAAQIACGAAVRHRPARILAFACELCTPNVRHDLAEAAACPDPANVSIAGALFSDAAAAFVLCNEYAVQDEQDAIFQLMEWDNATIPDTIQHMAFYADPQGMFTISQATQQMANL
jgi:fungal type III polyketide synthase